MSEITEFVWFLATWPAVQLLACGVAIGFASGFFLAGVLISRREKSANADLRAAEFSTRSF